MHHTQGAFDDGGALCETQAPYDVRACQLASAVRPTEFISMCLFTVEA